MTSPSSKRPPEAFMSANVFELGMGHVVLSRFTSRDVESGVFLLDVGCLGVKDAFYTRVSLAEYEDRLLGRVFAGSGRKAMDPCCARKLVEDAIAYARDLGFAPHRDYKQAARVFGGISTQACASTFTFGKDGKPCFVQGPYDSPEKCARIMQVLRNRCGEGNFYYLLVAHGSPLEDEP